MVSWTKPFSILKLDSVVDSFFKLLVLLQAEIEILKKDMQLQSEEETTLDLLREDFEMAENEALLCRYIHK